PALSRVRLLRELPHPKGARSSILRGPGARMGQVANPVRASSPQVVAASPAALETRIQKIAVAHQWSWIPAPVLTAQMALVQQAQMVPVLVLKRLAAVQTAVAQVAVLVRVPPLAAGVRGQRRPGQWFPEQVVPAAS